MVNAMTAEPTRYTWSVFCTWGLTLCVAALTIAGVLAMFLDLDAQAAAEIRNFCVIAFAGVAAFALASANNAAAAAMHAISEGKTDWPTLGPSVFCTVGFCLVSVAGVHMGWEIMAASVGPGHTLPDVWMVDLAGLYLAVAKPAMSWVIEGRRQMDKKEAKAPEAAPPAIESDRPAALDSQGGRGSNPSPPRPRPKLVETASKVAAGALAATTPAMADAAERTIVEPAADKAVLDMLARDAIIGGVAGRNALIRAVPGLTKARAAELLDELSPGWRVKAA